MRLNVLAGSRDLLRPEVLASKVVGNLVGHSVKAVTAYWIWPESGDKYHDFLQEKPGDDRTAVMAEAIRDGFGSRYQPLLVLADLLQECAFGARSKGGDTAADRRSQLAVISEILGRGYVRSLCLYGVSLPPDSDPDGCWAVPAGIVTEAVGEQMKALQAELSNQVEADSITAEVIEVTPELPAFRTLYDNALCNLFARRVEPRLRECGWAPDTDGVAGAISAILGEWNDRGMPLGLPLRQDHVDGLTELMLKNLLQD